MVGTNTCRGFGIAAALLITLARQADAADCGLSPESTLALSLAGWLAPQVSGLGLIEVEQHMGNRKEQAAWRDNVRIVGGSLIFLGATFGPSTHRFCSGQVARGLGMSGLRIVASGTALVAGARSVLCEDDEDSPECTEIDPPLFILGAASYIGLAVYDFRHALLQSRLSKKVEVAPYLDGHGNRGLRLRVGW